MRLILLSFFLACQFFSFAQDSLKTVQVQDVQITATRIPVNFFQAPIAIQNIKLNPSISSSQNHSLLELLITSPGLYMQNQYNSAQDLRISIRGFGARSAFGIRGVRILMDDIPLSTPDGQGQVDNIFVGGLKNIEILNGASSALYGNASGGVISMKTFSDSEESSSLVNVGLGSYGDFRASLERHQVLEKIKIDNQISLSSHKGYRAHSESANYIYNGRLKRKLGNNQEVDIILNTVVSPKGNDPGGVNLEDVQANRDAARPRNVEFKAGEELFQVSTGIKYRNEINARTDLKAKVYFINRIFNNRLPFENGGQVDLRRRYGGVSAHLNHEFAIGEWQNNILGGLDFLTQTDHRKRFVNSEGERGAETLNQLEQFYNQAAFINFRSSYDRLLVNAALRFDNNQIKVDDLFPADGVSNGRLSLPSLSPSLSGSYNVWKYHFLSAAYSYGFETPTLSELSSRPDNNGGFNTSLRPQQSHNLEIGYKAIWSDYLSFTTAIFTINTNDELLPYELEEFPGRTFYRNSGKTRRKGVEIHLQVRPLKFFNVNFAYTYSDFRFKEFESFSGNNIPGIPKHNFATNAEFRNEKWSVNYSLRLYSGIYADNANEEEIPQYSLSSLSASRKIGAFRPYIGINNLFNSMNYYDNIRLNAFGGRFYEAGPPRNFYLGLKFEF